GLDDRVRVVAHELVEHLLGVLRAVDERVDVGPRQLCDAAEDALLLRHGSALRCVEVSLMVVEVSVSGRCRGAREVRRGDRRPASSSCSCRNGRSSARSEPASAAAEAAPAEAAAAAAEAAATAAEAAAPAAEA